MRLIVTDKKETLAQFYERLQQRVALCVMMMSVAYGFGTAQFFVPAVADQLGTLQTIAAVAAALLVLPLTIQATLKRTRNRKACREPEGFVAEAARKAGFGAWTATFIVLVFLSAVTRRTFADVPAETIIQMVLSVSLAAFAIAFFWLSRDVADDEDDFADEAGQ